MSDDILPPEETLLESELKRIASSIPTIVVDNETQPINVVELNPEARRKIGRPSTFSQPIADQILSLLSNGKTLREICEMDGMPARETVFSWICRNPRFSLDYAHAREAHCDWWFDELAKMALEETDPFQANLLKLKIDTLKWRVAKMSARYRDKPSGSAPDGDSGPSGMPAQASVDVNQMATGDREALKQLLLKAKG